MLREREALAESSKSFIVSSCHLCLVLYQREVDERVKGGPRIFGFNEEQKETRRNHMRG